jgi:hypothetical protein
VRRVFEMSCDGIGGQSFAIRRMCDGCSLPGEKVGVRASVETNFPERDLQVASAGESKRGGNFNSDGEAA